MQGEYERFRLDQTAGVRVPVLRYRLPLDRPRFRAYAADVAGSARAGLRVGSREWTPSRSVAIPKAAADDSWAGVEALRAWNDVCTQWCTARYFPDAFSRVNLVANVVRAFEALRAESRWAPFHVVFKGGVMIRAVLLEFLQNLPLANRMRATDALVAARALSMSDFDFEVVQDAPRPPADSVHRLLALQYAVLLWVQRALQDEREGRCDGGLLYDAHDAHDARDGADLLRARLQAATAQLPAGHPLHGATVDAVSLSEDPVQGEATRRHRTRGGEAAPRARRNVVIFECDGTRCVMDAHDYFHALGVRGVRARSGGSHFYCTLNQYIGDEERAHAGHLPSLFHLARIKHSFVVYYTTREGERRIDRLGGEIIDLSQSHGRAVDQSRRRLYEAVRVPYRDYPLIGVDPAEVRLRSYTLEGFLWDHVLMLHHGAEPYPWRANKLGKRLMRYAAYLVMAVLAARPRDGRRALECACERTRSVGALADGGRRPPTTGVAEVDAFVARERGAVLGAPVGEKRNAARYLRTLHGHLCALVEGMPATATDDVWVTDAVTLPALWFTNHQGVERAAAA